MFQSIDFEQSIWRKCSRTPLHTSKGRCRAICAALTPGDSKPLAENQLGDCNPCGSRHAVFNAFRRVSQVPTQSARSINGGTKVKAAVSARTPKKKMTRSRRL